MSNIVINGATYKNVPSIQVPNEDGEMVEFEETSDIDKILNRTINFYSNDRITNVGAYSFNSCINLCNASFGSVTDFQTYSFSNCSNLRVLIVGKNEVATLSSSNALSSTPIASGTGYIYVPKSLVDSYKSATNWSVYAKQIRALEEYTSDGINLLQNSSLHDGYGDWAPHISTGGTVEFVEKDGYQCLHLNSSALAKTTYFDQSILPILSANTEYTISGWYWTENIVKGTTNCTLRNFYANGYYNKDEKSTYFTVPFSEMNINTGGWIYFTNTFTTPTSDTWNNATSFNLMLYTRDFTGDIYIRDLKIEKGNKATI